MCHCFTLFIVPFLPAVCWQKKEPHEMNGHVDQLVSSLTADCRLTDTWASFTQSSFSKTTDVNFMNTFALWTYLNSDLSLESWWENYCLAFTHWMCFFQANNLIKLFNTSIIFFELLTARECFHTKLNTILCKSDPFIFLIFLTANKSIIQSQWLRGANVCLQLQSGCLHGQRHVCFGRNFRLWRTKNLRYWKL